MSKTKKNVQLALVGKCSHCKQKIHIADIKFTKNYSQDMSLIRIDVIQLLLDNSILCKRCLNEGPNHIDFYRAKGHEVEKMH
jgi:hypothetical protein